MLKINVFLFTLLLSATAFGQSTGTYTPPTKRDIKNGNLSDTDKYQMENYTHQGYQQREADQAWAEACGTDADCNNIRNGGDATEGEKFGGMSPALFKGVAKAYSMIMPMIGQAGGGKFGKIDRTTKADVETEWSERGMTKNSDGVYEVTDQEAFDKWNNSQPDDLQFKDGTRNKTTTKTTIDSKTGERTTIYEDVKDKDGNVIQEKQEDVAAQEEEKAEKEEGADYCQYIPMGTEIIAGVMQKQSDDFALATEPKTENAQSAALFKQARAHKDRQKSVDIQRKGWGATTVCYTAMMFQPGAVGGWTNWVKLGAAALMTKYYMWEYDLHGDAADKVNRVASKLSGKGKCNPVSDRDCYCSQPETENDVKYCYPQIRQRLAQDNTYQVTCVDNNVKEDLNCACRTTNSCLDSRIQAKINDMYIPGGLGASLEEFYKMTNGVSTPGDNVSKFRASSGKMFAIANDKLKEGLNKIKLPDSYKKKDDAVAKALRELGFNGTVANAMSAAPETKESKEAGDKLARGFRGLSSKGSAKYTVTKKDNGLYFKGGGGLNNTKSTKKAAANPFAHLLKKKKAKSGSATAEILDYSQRAQMNAGITKDKSRSIFEIISRRYRYTASKKLGVQ